MKIRLLERLADAFPYLVLSASIAGVIFCLAIDRMSYLVNGSILAIPALLGSFAFTRVKKRDPGLSEEMGIFRISPTVSALCFVLLYSVSIAVFFVTPSGSKLGLAAVLAMYAVTLVQILARRLIPALVLAEIVAALATTIYSTTLRAALYFGATDIMPHMYMSTVTAVSGRVIPAELGTYTYFPLYHIAIALSSLVMGLDIQTTLFATTCLIFTSTALFLYFLVARVFRNRQLSLLVVLTYAMNGTVVYYGTYMVTRTLAYVGFLLLLYLLYAEVRPKADDANAAAGPAAFRILTVTAFVFILFTHQISTPMIIALLAFIWLLGVLIRDVPHVKPVFLIVPVSLFAVYWIFAASSFIWELFPRTEASLYSAVVFTKVEYLGLSFLVNRLDMLFIIFFALIGAAYLVWKQQPRHAIVFGFFGLAAVALNVPNVLSSVFQLVEVLRMDRYALLFLPFLAIVMGTGLYLLARCSAGRKRAIPVIGVLVIIPFVLYGVGSLGLVREDPAHERYSFATDETTGFAHVLKTVPSGSPIYTDYHTMRFFSRTKTNQSEALGIPYYTSYSMQVTLDVWTKAGYIAIPDRQFRQHGLTFMKEDEFDPEMLQTFLPTDGNVLNMTRRLAQEEKIYTSSGLDLYYFAH